MEWGFALLEHSRREPNSASRLWRSRPLSFSFRVWTDESFGDFDQAVNIAIAKLRSALGDSAENPRYIETLPKRGYRFIADVSVVDADAPTQKGQNLRPEICMGQSLGMSSKAPG